MTEVLIGLGGNLGNVRASFERAIEQLCEQGTVRVVAQSSDYSTPPWGIADQPRFVNRAIAVETTLTPQELLALALEIERKLGRDRTQGPKNGPRVIDIDLLAYDGATIDEPGLILPHPRLLDRAFVLVPLAEIRPDAVIAGRRVADGLRNVDSAGIERLTD